MPLYQYTCQKCNGTFDQLVRTADRDSKIKCPECGSTKTARALSLITVGGESKGVARGPRTREEQPGMLDLPAGLEQL